MSDRASTDEFIIGLRAMRAMKLIRTSDETMEKIEKSINNLSDEQYEQGRLSILRSKDEAIHA